MSNIKTETQACEASATNIEQLKQNAEWKISPDIINDLIALIKERFWEDISNPFDITCQELDALKSQLEGEKANKQEILRKFVYKEFLEKKWISWASLDTLFVDIKDPTALDMKKSFDEGIDKYLLSQYTFLSPESKSVIKLWLANKVLKEFLYWKFKWNFEAFNSFMAKLSSWSIKWISEVKEAVEWQKDSAKEVEEFIKWLIWQYKTAFDKIQQDEKINWLNDEQKQNVISHVSWFRDPTLVEQGADTIDFNQINPLNKDSKNNNIDDINKISEYMAKSKWNLDTLMWALQQWEAVSNVIYKMIDVPVVWDVIKEFIEFLLWLPFIWPWLAALLWLNWKDAIKDFNESISLHKFFNSFKQLWVQFNEKWEKQKWTWVEPFKDKDLSNISFRALKWEMKSIRGMFPNLKEEEYWKFWQTVFTTWVEKDGITFKLDLTDEQKSKDKLETKDFKSILSEWLNKYNTEKANKEREAEEERLRQEEEKRQEEQIEKEKRIKKLSEEIPEIDDKLKSIQSEKDSLKPILNWEYVNIPNWSSKSPSWFGLDFSEIDVNDISWNTENDFSKLIIEKCWERNYNWIDLSNKVPVDIASWVPYRWLTDEQKNILNRLFWYIREYCSVNKVSFDWKVKDFLSWSNKDKFEKFLEDKMTKLQSDEDENNKLSESKKQEKASLEWDTKWYELKKSTYDAVSKVNNHWTLKTPFELWWDLWTIIFDSSKQELTVWKEVYKISLTNEWQAYNIDDISVSDGKVQFVVKTWSTLVKEVNKGIELEKILRNIRELIFAWKTEYKDWKTFLSIGKQIDEKKEEIK